MFKTKRQIIIENENRHNVIQKANNFLLSQGFEIKYKDNRCIAVKKSVFSGLKIKFFMDFLQKEKDCLINGKFYSLFLNVFPLSLENVSFLYKTEREKTYKLMLKFASTIHGIIS